MSDYSQKKILDDVAVFTHQKFPPYLTRRNFPSDEIYQQYFELLNDTLLAVQRGVQIR